MPAGRRLFFPVVNVVFLITEPNEDEQVAREFVNEFMDGVLTDPDLSLSVTVDSQEIATASGFSAVHRIVAEEQRLRLGGW